MNYMYTDNYCLYPDYYVGYYDPVRLKTNKRNIYSTNQGSINSDIDESVKHLIQLSKEQIAKEKELSTSIKDTNNDIKTHIPNPIVGDTNRLSKHVVDILENIYQTSTFINRKRREEIAEELNLPIEKVRNWFQNRRGKDRRLNQVQQFASRKYIRSGKYARKVNGSDDFYYYDQRPSDYGPTENMNHIPINSVILEDHIAVSPPEKLEPINLTFINHSPPTAGTMPYWPASNWNNEEFMVSNVGSSDNSKKWAENRNYLYAVMHDNVTNKSFTILRDSTDSLI